MSSGDQRVDTITKFLEYANKELKPMGVNVCDVFGYSALVENAPGIGQSFLKFLKCRCHFINDLSISLEQWRFRFTSTRYGTI